LSSYIEYVTLLELERRAGFIVSILQTEKLRFKKRQPDLPNVIQQTGTESFLESY